MRVHFTAITGSGQRDVNLTNNQAVVVTEVRDPFTADLNGDREVNFTDFLVLANHFGMDGTFEQGDIDGNGRVDFLDFLLLAQRFGRRT